MYAKADLLRSTILKPWERHVERAAAALKEQMAQRDEEHVLDVLDLEFHFDSKGHGLVALQAFEDVETTTDILNGCTSLAQKCEAHGWANLLAILDAELVWQWREIVFQMLYTPVMISGQDATGEECVGTRSPSLLAVPNSSPPPLSRYAERAELQEKLNAYV